ncbi:hypothetical protein [Nocardia sp. NPDC050710]|uniref:hypothetical protein n=1 Tax=Nocardia sp. NPDC050710 TaxID=3157220 RepID=UPI0033DA3E42
MDPPPKPVPYQNPGSGQAITDYLAHVAKIDTKKATLAGMDDEVAAASAVVAGRHGHTMREIEGIVDRLNCEFAFYGSRKLQPSDEARLVWAIADSMEHLYRLIGTVLTGNHEIADGGKGGGGKGDSGSGGSGSGGSGSGGSGSGGSGSGGSGSPAGGGGGDGGLGGLLQMLGMLPMMAMPLMQMLPELLNGDKDKDDEKDEKKGEEPKKDEAPAPAAPAPGDPNASATPSPTGTPAQPVAADAAAPQQNSPVAASA